MTGGVVSTNTEVVCGEGRLVIETRCEVLVRIVITRGVVLETGAFIYGEGLIQVEWVLGAVAGSVAGLEAVRLDNHRCWEVVIEEQSLFLWGRSHQCLNRVHVHARTRSIHSLSSVFT